MATKAQERRFTQTSNDHQRAVISNLKVVSQRHGMSRVFSDFVEMAALALARLDRTQFNVRETRYLQVAGQYDRDELELLTQAFSHLVLAFESNFDTDDEGNVRHVKFADTLGSIYMMLDLGNSSAGQFFTPYDVSLLMARINTANANNLVAKNGFVRLLEPAVGAGGMVIATAQVLAEEGLNYQRYMHATAIDIDIRCVHMTYVQLSLLHIPAAIVHGNALTHDIRSVWYTPAHILHGWDEKLRKRDHALQVRDKTDKATEDIEVSESNEPTPALSLVPKNLAQSEQLMLF